MSYYAVLKIGAVTVMNNPVCSDVELEYQFNDAGAKVLITLDMLVERMADLRPKTGIRQIIYTSLGHYLPLTKSIPFSLTAKKSGLKTKVKASDNILRWKDLIAGHLSGAVHVELEYDDIAMLQYTGGYDHVFFAVHNVEVALRIHSGDIAGMQPTVFQCFGSFLGIVPIALHDLRSFDDQLSGLADGHFSAAVLEVYDATIRIRKRQADTSDFAFSLKRIGVGYGRRFGQAKSFGDGRTGYGFKTFHHFNRQRGTA